jgi:hypothetical protein
MLHTSLPLIPAHIIAKHFGLADSGATGHFFTTNAKVINKQIALDPLKVKIPDGNILQSSHTCELDLPKLPLEARRGHIMPGMKGHSLVSLVQLCMAGCTITISESAMNVWYKGELVLKGQKCNRTGLWLVPITEFQTDLSAEGQATEDVAGNVYHTSSRAEWIQYLHQACFSPTIATWCKAIDNDQFLTFPGLTSAAVRKYLPPSTATVKGHMARPQQGIRSSTRPKRTRTKIALVSNVEEEHDEDMNPMEEPEAGCELFVGATIGELNENTLYTDLTGKFPIKSYHGNHMVFVAYAYGPNAILARPMRNRSDTEMIKAYTDIYEYLKSKGFKPRFNVSDNECSKTIKNFIREQQATIQLVEPDNHRVNAAERAIQTFKNHFIAGLATVDKNFPIQLWDELIPQAQDTLNLLRTSRVNKHLSAYAVLEGPFNFDKTPLAPPGTKAVIYNDPSSRTSWGPHGEDAWYVNRAPEHWRCYKFFVPNTKAFRISGAAKFFPTHCKMPTVEPGDTVCLAAQDLITALNNPQPNAPIDLEPRHNQALRDLSNIFQQSVKQTSEGDGKSPRVATEPSTSHDTTAPRVLRLAPRIHQRRTRSNTPFLPTIQEEAAPKPTTNKISKKHDARMERRQARAAVREAEEKAIQQAIKENIQNIKEARLRKIREEQERVIIEPVGPKNTNEKENNDSNRPIPITQECDSVVEKLKPEISQPKQPCGLKSVTPKRFAKDALYHMIANHVESYSSAFVPEDLKDGIGSINMQVPLEEMMGAGVVNPETGETLTKYEQLLKVPALRKIWSVCNRNLVD